MKTLVLELPSMFGDHHVVEVRRLLFEVPGVSEVYASSSFQVVEIQYDESAIDGVAIEAKLAESGYLGELPVPVERGALAERENGNKPYFRHTAAYEQAGRSVSFAQATPYVGRPLWPCPGMGPIPSTAHGTAEKLEEEVSNG